MQQRVIKVIKKFPPLYRSANFSYQFLFSPKSSLLFLKSFLLDPATIKNKWYREIKKTQLDESKPLFLDRQSEIKEFFSVSDSDLLGHYLRYGFPNTNKFREHYFQAFYGLTDRDNLKKAYDSCSFDYALRLMLAYERYSTVTDYLDFIVEDSRKNLGDFRVLDYGCGVSDIGLLFASFGANVTICDLDNLRFDFTIWRFKKRGLNPEVIRVIDTEAYPELPGSEFDLIIATELFEHVRNPLELLRNFTKALKSAGYLFDSMGGNFERDERPHHLKEAFEIGQSNEYVEFYSSHYVHLFPGKDLRYLFRRR
jgi:2-polyprenyl-3-methyl-5-hydroxy-6-metoxy-1,4-benzoquinol methylase